MPRAATIKSLPHAFRMMKTMQAQGIEWGEDYRHAARAALKDILQGRMVAGIDRHLAEMAGRGAADRRNGSYSRWLMSELGEIELAVPRTRSWSALTVVRAYARRAGHIDRMILACFVLGLSTRKVAIALLPILGRRISAATVSAVVKTLDAAVAAFHRRPLKDIYPVLMLDGDGGVDHRQGGKQAGPAVDADHLDARAFQPAAVEIAEKELPLCGALAGRQAVVDDLLLAVRAQAQRHQHRPAQRAHAGLAAQDHAIEHQDPILVLQGPAMERGDRGVEGLGDLAHRGGADPPAEDGQ